MKAATELMKEKSEKIQGKKIVISDRKTLISALPEIPGWVGYRTM